MTRAVDHLTPADPAGSVPPSTTPLYPALDIKRAAARGTLALAARQVATFVANFVAGVLLARTLSPQEYGALALLLFVVNLGKVLVDLGLSASLVQLDSEPTDRERGAVLAVEIVIAVLLTAGVIGVAGPLCDLANAAPGSVLSLQIAALSFLTTPVVALIGCALERRLDFGRQGLLLAIQPVLFGITAVALAWAGWGVLALGVGLTASNVATMVAALVMRQKLPRPRWSPSSARPHVQFGVPYMGVNVVSSVKDSVIPLLIGALAGGAAVGYVSWAQQVATVGAYSLFVLGRLLFPVFARLRSSPEQLRAAVDRILFAANLVVAPISAAIAVFATDIVHLFYGDKWLVAVPMLYLLMLGNLVAPTSTVLLALMSALGRPRISLLFASIWLVSTWAFVWILTPLLGFQAYGWANAGVQLTSAGLVIAARRVMRFAWIRALMVPWAIAVIAFAVPLLLERTVFPAEDVLSLVSLGCLGLLLFFGLALLVAREQTTYLMTTFLKRRSR